jgi:hypothetical protein
LFPPLTCQKPQSALWPVDLLSLSISYRWNLTTWGHLRLASYTQLGMLRFVLLQYLSECQCWLWNDCLPVLLSSAVFFFIISFIHMCIQCLGHFSFLLPSPRPLPFPCPLPFSLTPCYQAETILPLSLILLKREYKQ